MAVGADRRQIASIAWMQENTKLDEYNIWISGACRHDDNANLARPKDSLVKTSLPVQTGLPDCSSNHWPAASTHVQELSFLLLSHLPLGHAGDEAVMRNCPGAEGFCSLPTSMHPYKHTIPLQWQRLIWAKRQTTLVKAANATLVSQGGFVIFYDRQSPVSEHAGWQFRCRASCI